MMNVGIPTSPRTAVAPIFFTQRPAIYFGKSCFCALIASLYHRRRGALRHAGFGGFILGGFLVDLPGRIFGGSQPHSPPDLLKNPEMEKSGKKNSPERVLPPSPVATEEKSSERCEGL